MHCCRNIDSISSGAKTPQLSKGIYASEHLGIITVIKRCYEIFRIFFIWGNCSYKGIHVLQMAFLVQFFYPHFTISNIHMTPPCTRYKINSCHYLIVFIFCIFTVLSISFLWNSKSYCWLPVMVLWYYFLTNNKKKNQNVANNTRLK